MRSDSSARPDRRSVLRKEKNPDGTMKKQTKQMAPSASESVKVSESESSFSKGDHLREVRKSTKQLQSSSQSGSSEAGKSSAE